MGVFGVLAVLVGWLLIVLLSSLYDHLKSGVVVVLFVIVLFVYLLIAVILGFCGLVVCWADCVVW